MPHSNSGRTRCESGLPKFKQADEMQDRDDCLEDQVNAMSAQLSSLLDLLSGSGTGDGPSIAACKQQAGTAPPDGYDPNSTANATRRLLQEPELHLAQLVSLYSTLRPAPSLMLSTRMDPRSIFRLLAASSIHESVGTLYASMEGGHLGFFQRPKTLSHYPAQASIPDEAGLLGRIKAADARDEI